MIGQIKETARACHGRVFFGVASTEGALVSADLSRRKGTVLQALEEAQYDLRNPASGRVMEHAGFRREGVLRERILNKGEYVDVALCSLLRSDLPASP